MNIIGALLQEESKLHRQLTAIQSAIAALNGDAKTATSLKRASIPKGFGPKRTMSAAVKAKIARAAKVRWAKIRAERAKKAK